MERVVERGNLPPVSLIWRERRVWVYELSESWLGRVGHHWSCLQPPIHLSGTTEVLTPVERECQHQPAMSTPAEERNAALVFKWQKKRRMVPPAAEATGCSASLTHQAWERMK